LISRSFTSSEGCLMIQTSCFSVVMTVFFFIFLLRAVGVGVSHYQTEALLIFR
jgi:hypothetical protein